jgi:hypothetical protein
MQCDNSEVFTFLLHLCNPGDFYHSARTHHYTAQRLKYVSVSCLTQASKIASFAIYDGGALLPRPAPRPNPPRLGGSQ